jgi:hypothetical protein
MSLNRRHKDIDYGKAAPCEWSMRTAFRRKRGGGVLAKRVGVCFALSSNSAVSTPRQESREAADRLKTSKHSAK